MRKLFTVLIALVTLTGCASQQNELHREDLRKKASFDLDCPEKELELTVIKKIWNGREKQMGVEGCGKRASYIITQGEWLRD